MNRTDRLYAIDSALRAAGSRGRSARWLAERFEVSTRTIKRDMAALAQGGLPIVAQEGCRGGYRLLNEATLPPVQFTAAQASAIAIALAGEPQMPFAGDGAAAIQKLLAAMTDGQRNEAEQLAARVWMRAAPLRARSRAARVLDEALRTQRVAIIDYVDGQQRTTIRRRVEAMAFVRSQHHWHLLAWCQLRKAGRWFRLDRVRRASLTKAPCEPRELGDVFGEAPETAQPVVLPR